jgi:putative PIG3 family NAD(P)H quinone oxidoreductase
MTAIAVREGQSDAEALYPTSLSTPKAGPGEILIRVRAAGVNRPDIVQRKGLYPPPPGAPFTLGLEVAGEVVEIGDGPCRWDLSDKVCALLGGGGYAEYAVVDSRHALPAPQNLSFAEAASLPETIFTVFTNVFERAHLAAGETFMLHGATSGIGVTAIQMAKAFGARVIATSRGQEKAERAKDIGADIAIDTTQEDFVEVARAAGGVDVILDMVGGADFTARNLKALNPDGRLVLIAIQAGAKAEVDLGRLLVNRLTFTASTLRPRSADEKARLAQAVEATIWPLIAKGALKPIIDKIFPLADAAAAHTYLESGSHVGKVVLVP